MCFKESVVSEGPSSFISPPVDGACQPVRPGGVYRESFGVVGLELRAFLCKDNIDIAKVPSRIMIVFLIFAADLESAMPCYV